jgi:hypothetical protein
MRNSISSRGPITLVFFHRPGISYQRMPKLTGNQIRELAKSIIASSPGGIRYNALVQEILRRNPETPENTIHGSVWNLAEKFPNEVSKPSRGLFTPESVPENDTVSVEGAEQAGAEQVVVTTTVGVKIKESDFYEPFAEWLKNDLDEATKVAPLGGGLKGKWGTPDVVGTYKKRPGNVIEFPIEIVSAEIKIDPLAPVVAFGQAIAYRLFSTKTYIAMPTTLTEEDQDRLDSLCMLFGVGLVFFELDKDKPQFKIRVRAQRFYPDMFYAHEFADRLKQHNSEIFTELFG